MNTRRGFLKGLVGLPVAYVVGAGFTAEQPPTLHKIGKIAARFRIDGGEWQEVSIPIMADTAGHHTADLDYIYVEITPDLNLRSMGFKP